MYSIYGFSISIAMRHTILGSRQAGIFLHIKSIKYYDYQSNMYIIYTQVYILPNVAVEYSRVRRTFYVVSLVTYLKMIMKIKFSISSILFTATAILLICKKKHDCESEQNVVQVSDHLMVFVYLGTLALLAAGKQYP